MTLKTAPNLIQTISPASSPTLFNTFVFKSLDLALVFNISDSRACTHLNVLFVLSGKEALSSPLSLATQSSTQNFLFPPFYLLCPEALLLPVPTALLLQSYHPYLYVLESSHGT